jgi:hypothetical protein
MCGFSWEDRMLYCSSPLAPSWCWRWKHGCWGSSRTSFTLLHPSRESCFPAPHGTTGQSPDPHGCRGSQYWHHNHPRKPVDRALNPIFPYRKVSLASGSRNALMGLVLDQVKDL